MEFLRGQRDKRNALSINDPDPLGTAAEVWSTLAQIATVGIFLLLLVIGLYLGRAILLPAFAAVLIGTTLAPIINRANRVGLPGWLTALVLVTLMMVVGAVVVTLLAAPIADWISKAPEIGERIKQQLYLFERPLSALQELENALMPAAPAVAVEPSKFSMVTPVLAFVTPALAQAVLFFATLIFFLAGEVQFRRHLAGLFATRDGKLRFIRIANDIEENLASYVAVVTVINLALGTIVAAGAWLLGLPSPLILGLLAMLLNYIPYVGPTCMAFILLAIGFATFSSLTQALVAPAALIVLCTLEGHLVTPAVLGNRLTLNPLLVFLAIAFWSWLWGPLGAFLAVPLLIVGMVVLGHVFPAEDSKLPG